MSPFFLTCVIVLAIAQVALPKRLAFLPLLIAACHLGNLRVVPEMTIFRILIVLGLVRAMAGGFFTWSRHERLDVVMLLFSIFAVLSGFGHTSNEYSPNPFLYRMGLVLNAVGTYLYARAYLQSLTDVKAYAAWLPFVLLPLAILLLQESRSGQNMYHQVGAGEFSAIRDDKIRAQGPFGHPILAGTVGAVSLPFMVLLWRQRRFLSLIGILSCIGIAFASASSGPLASLAFGVVCLFIWRWRHKMRTIQGLVLLMLFVLNLVMNRPIWYVISMIDLVGGSTGWHRSRLLEQGFNNLDDWWLWGTDYTRHWMASGVSWSPDHVDMTNYYLHLGVIGGLPLMICLFAMLIVSFKALGRRMTVQRESSDPEEFWLWCAGCSLAAHAISFISISYFDQMYVIFYFLIGMIPVLVRVPTETPSGGKGLDPEPVGQPGAQAGQMAFR